MANNEEQKKIDEAREWVYAGKPCVKRYGLRSNGARSRAITTKEAKELIDSGDFAFGFCPYSLKWWDDALEFNILSGSDLD